MGRLLGTRSVFVFWFVFCVQIFFLTFAHRKQTKKQKLKIATMALEWMPVMYFGVISLDSRFWLSRSSNNSDMGNSFRSNFCQIRPLVIILWPNILGLQQGVLNSLLTTIPNRNYRADRSRN